MVLSNFKKYDGWLYPRNCLQKKKDNICDDWMCLHMIIENDSVTEEEREKGHKEKTYTWLFNKPAMQSEIFHEKYMDCLNFLSEQVPTRDSINTKSDGEEE